MIKPVICRRQTSRRSVTVVKVGGSLAPFCREIITALQSAGRPLLIVPGGGKFADAVRSSDACKNPDSAHWMACAAMDQYGWELASHGMDTTVKISRPDRPRILIPYCALRRLDPLPHSWDVTGDTIAAWVAGRVGSDLLVLKSVDGIFHKGKLLRQVRSPVKTDVVDPCFIPYVLEHRITTTVLNGSDVDRVYRWLDGQEVPGTVIGTTF